MRALFSSNLLLQAKQLCSIITVRFCNVWGYKYAKNTQIDGRNDECLIYYDNMLAQTKLSLQQCLITKTMAVVLHLTYSPYLAPCHFFLFPRRKSQLWWHHFQESWNSGKTANCPTNNSEEPVWAVLPAVTEILVPLHKLRRGLQWCLQQWPVIMVSIYFVTDSGRLLSVTPLCIHYMTANLHVTDAPFWRGYDTYGFPVIMTFRWNGFAHVTVEKHLSPQSEISI